MEPLYFPTVFTPHTDAAGVETISARVLDVPGAISWGHTLPEALARVREALALALEDETEIPAPTSYEDAAASLKDEGALAIVQLVEFLPPEPVVRVNITFPGDLLKRIDAHTANRSAWLADAAREKLAAAVAPRTPDAIQEMQAARALALAGFGKVRGGTPIADKAPARVAAPSAKLAAKIFGQTPARDAGGKSKR